MLKEINDNQEAWSLASKLNVKYLVGILGEGVAGTGLGRRTYSKTISVKQ